MLNDIKQIIDELNNYLHENLDDAYRKIVTVRQITDERFGDLTIPLFAILKTKEKEKILNNIQQLLLGNQLVEKTEFVKGFLNIFLDRVIVSKRILNDVLAKKLFEVNVGKGKKIVVEHTSSNPTGPIHVGNFRSSVLGDVLYRLLKKLGFDVNVRYYVNDMGRQIAPLAICHDLLEKNGVSFDERPDLWIGKIYSLSNLFYEISQIQNLLKDILDVSYLKNYLAPLEIIEPLPLEDALKNLKEDSEESRKTLEEQVKRIKKLFDVQGKLKEILPELYAKLKDLLLSKVDNFYETSNALNLAYEHGNDERAKRLIKNVCANTLKGHETVLKMFDMHVDDFDWESEVVWSSLFKKIVEKIKESPNVLKDGNLLVLEADKSAEHTGFKKDFSFTRKIPSGVLINSLGVSLYPLRDAAYTVYKYEKAGKPIKIYNVIGKAQEVAQLHVKLILYETGYKEIARSLVHYKFENVSLVSRTMSRRLLQYVTPDEMYALTLEQVLENILKSRDYDPEIKKKIAEAVAQGTVRYSILKVQPNKVVNFDPKLAVDLNQNTAPFIMYAYTRAINILKKAGLSPSENIDVVVTNISDIEWKLVKLFSNYVDVLLTCYMEDRLDPLTNYAHDLAQSFNKFYETLPVITEKEPVKSQRLAIVMAVMRVFEELFDIMGLKPLERM